MKRGSASMFHLLFKEISAHLTTYVLYTLYAKVPFTGRDITTVCVTKFFRTISIQFVHQDKTRNRKTRKLETREKLCDHLKIMHSTHKQVRNLGAITNPD